MRNIHQLFFCLLLCLLSTTAGAQEKYALLVGINQYYTDPGKPYHSSLRGCVNDAHAIKSVLVRRFGFSEKNILLLSDEGAGKERVMEGFNNILSKCKAGDAFVFYFSGHGVWMKNAFQSKLDEKVKNGMNQAMVMSNLYADNLDCLFTDAQVKRTFNKFIDKKVISTAILDCCFSGMIPATYEVQPVNDYELEIPAQGINKSIPFLEIYENYAGYTTETKGSYNEDSVNTLLINRLADPDSKSFNLKDAIQIRDASHVTRPSERPGSMFLSLGATNEYEKGLDIADETETYHGAYTAALLHVLKRNPVTISVAELIRRTNLQMKTQHYPQTPMHFADRQRLLKNLIGINPVDFTDNLMATCTKNNGKEILLDAGVLDGLAADNVLQSRNKSITIRVTAAQKNTASATVIKGSAAGIKKGDRFILSSSVTKSAPLVKVFFAGADISVSAFIKGMTNNEMSGLLQMPNYRDYSNWEKSRSRNVFYSGNFTSKTNIPGILLGTLPEDFLVFLPVPTFITEPLKNTILKNQNVALVNMASDADLILYLNYTKGGNGQKSKYVFTWTKLAGTEINEPGFLRFSKSNVSVSALTANNAENKILALRINDLLAPHIRSRTTHWLSNWPE